MARSKALMVVPTLVLTGLGFFLTNTKGRTAGEIMLATVTAATDTIEAVTFYRSVVTNFRTLPNLFEANRAVAARSFVESFKIGASKAAAVGAAIVVVATWAMFFAAWGTGHLSTDSVEFNNLLAGAVASTLVLVLTFFAALSVVGAIALAVVAIYDLLTLIICKAGVKAACSRGLTAALTKVIADWIYTGGVMIDLNSDPSLTNIEDVKLLLTQSQRGLVAGNGVRFQVDLLSVARHAVSEPSIIYHYDNFFTAKDLGSTTVKYALDTAKRNMPVDLNQTEWWNIRQYDSVSADVPSPVVGWLVPTIQSKALYQGNRLDTLTSTLYPFANAKINQSFALYLNAGSISATHHTDGVDHSIRNWGGFLVVWGQDLQRPG